VTSRWSFIRQLVIDYFSCNSNVETILKNSTRYVFPLSKSNTCENTGYRNWGVQDEDKYGSVQWYY